MTTILHLETATKVCSVALSKNGKLVQLFEISDDNYSHGEQLTLLIEKTLKAEGIAPKDLHAVSVCSGPGSYTGLRIGVSTAKGLCFALNIPLIAIDSLTSMYELAKVKYPTRKLSPMIDARRMEVFSAIFDKDGKQVKPIAADVLDDQSYSDFLPFIAFGDGAPKLQELWSGRDIQFDLDLAPSASGQVALALAKFNAHQFEDVAYFEPFYLKAFYQTKKA